MEAAYHKGSFILRRAFSALLFISLTPATTYATIATWQGPYVGAYLGGGFGNNDVSTNAGSVTSTSYFTSTADINAVNNAGTWENSPSSAILGIEAGHDWVWKQLIYGVVADYGALPLNSSENVTRTYPDSSSQYSVYTSMSTNWLFTLRGRVGYEVMVHWPSFLYLTGGMAMTQVTVKNSFSDNSSLAGAGGNSTSKNQIGWAAGAGIELASFGHATMDIEYLYVRMPSLNTRNSITNTAGGFGVPPRSETSPFSTNGKFHASLLKIGLNYRFDE